MPVRFRPINRAVDGESDRERMVRIRGEQSLRSLFIKVSQSASGDPAATGELIAKEIRDLPDAYARASRKDDWLKLAQSAGRIERYARSLRAIDERKVLLRQMVDRGMIE